MCEVSCTSQDLLHIGIVQRAGRPEAEDVVSNADQRGLPADQPHET